ncbi:MAG TPA: hypothetical protein VNN10_07610 [Dehalococcoidia bacterium]|nr:hypothetical protein [Dehalococcoidia bacterium]
MTTESARREMNGTADGPALTDAPGWRRWGGGREGPDWFRIAAAWTVVALVFIEAVLAFRLGFLLAAANTANGFVALVYDISAPLAAPFEGILAASKVGSSGAFEPSILVAMLAYLAAAGLWLTLVWAGLTTREEATRFASASARAGR